MLAQREIDWQALRKDYIESPLRPTHEELSERHGVKPGTIARCSSDEGWAVLRAQYLERRAKESDTLAVLMEVGQIDRTLQREAADYALSSLRGLKQAVAEAEKAGYKPSTLAQFHNTANFAFANLAKGLHDIGLTGVSKALKGAVAEGDGKWDPKILNQINLTVQQAKDGLEVKDVKAKPVQEAESAGVHPPAG